MGPAVLWIGCQHTSLVDGLLHRSQGTWDASTSCHGYHLPCFLVASELRLRMAPG